MAKERSFTEERERMVKEQLIARGIRDPRVLQAMRTVPRHRFIRREYRHLAYADGPLPIGHQQTISQPYIVALMTELLKLNGTERVLEVGTGSGYQAAVLSLLAAEVHSVERLPELTRQAQKVLQALGYTNVYLHNGDGSQGWPEHAPYQGVIITAAAPQVPPPIQDQLDNGGRIVIPVGGPYGQTLQLWTRQGDKWDREAQVPVAFVPLRGTWGWTDDKWTDY